MVAELLLWCLVIVLGVVARAKSRTALTDAGRRALAFARELAIRLPLALLAASFLTQILPRDIVGAAIGPDSGVLGILAATAAGSILPGGPFIAFPLAVSFYDAGAGLPQLVALITSWSTLGVIRIVAFEWPMLGPRFVALRVGVTLMLPPLAGAIAAGMLWIAR
ncbi:MAG: permease [Betaproteobacteria bacterium]|jgi:uncharacterized membrane protein YraQ (UPF0718 family)|nr:permease [Betaproteobacteria bacterium]